jgi:hypothetical protein
MHTDNFLVSSHEDDSPIDGPEPPPEFFVLGSVPTIIRCWITTHFAHHTIRYADLCTGSQRSTLDVALVREFGLMDEVERDVDGTSRIRIPVYLVEATVAERGHGHRAPSPGHQIPSIMATFEITGSEQGSDAGDAAAKKGIQIFIGSDTLRAHMADVLLSQNRMALLGNDREKLSVPFVRPEDESVFKHICTANMAPERPRLNANAAPFVLGTNASEADLDVPGGPEVGTHPGTEHVHDAADHADAGSNTVPGVLPLETGEGAKATPTGRDADDKAVSSAASVTGSVEGSSGNRRESGGAGGIWGSWRQGTDGGQRDSGPLSGYQPAGRGGRNMKVLKPLKSGTSSARTGTASTAFESAPGTGTTPGSGPRASGEQRRKSQATGTAASNSAATTGGSDSGSSNGLRWESKRSISTGGMGMGMGMGMGGGMGTGMGSMLPRDARSTTSNASAGSNAPNQAALPRSANPIGGASAFSWMNPAGKAKATATAE